MIERSHHIPWRDFSEEHSCACARFEDAGAGVRGRTQARKRRKCPRIGEAILAS